MSEIGEEIFNDPEAVPPDPRVFITQEGPFNYMPAADYGELVFLTSREITAVPNARMNGQTIQGMFKELHSYLPGRDYILLSGSPIAVAYTWLWLGTQYGRCVKHKVLKWDSQLNKYLEYSVEV